MPRLPWLPSRQPVTAADYNRLVLALNNLQAKFAAQAALPPLRLTAAFPLEARQRPGGWHVSLAYEEQAAVVELTGNLSLGSSGTARVLWWLGDAWQEAETAEITVHDALGTFEGNPGDKALVRFDRQSGQWIVWQLQC